MSARRVAALVARSVVAIALAGAAAACSGSGPSSAPSTSSAGTSIAVAPQPTVQPTSSAARPTHRPTPHQRRRSSPPAAPSSGAHRTTPSSTAAGPPPPAGEQSVTVTAAGETRHYLVEHPGAAGPRPLIVFLHGSGNSGAGVRDQLGMTAVAQRAGVVLVFPDGDPQFHSWRSGCCNPWADSNADFVFVAGIIHSLEASGEVDPSEVALGGFSSGALFANSFGCRYPGLVRGVLAIGGALLVPPAGVQDAGPSTPRCTPSRPVTMLELHGANDPAVPVSGSTAHCQASPCVPGTRGSLPSAATVDQWWRTMDGCSAPVKRSGSASVQLASCRSGTSVGLAILPGISHDLVGLVAQFPVQATLLELATGKPLSAW